MISNDNLIENNTILEKEAVNIVLHLNEYDKKVMSDFQKELIMEELNELPPLEDGQVCIKDRKSVV